LPEPYTVSLLNSLSQGAGEVRNRNASESRIRQIDGGLVHALLLYPLIQMDLLVKEVSEQQTSAA